jgi:hypothetical protein
MWSLGVAVMGGAVMPVRVLLFDVFGTLVDWRASLRARRDHSPAIP